MKFYIHKLGCPKNDVDADYIAARLIADGHQPTHDPEDADSILVNTCGFILQAKEESIHELLRLGQLKKAGDVKTVYATGCLSQRHGDELLEGLPEIDGAFGLGELDAIAQAVSGSEKLFKTVMTESRKLGYLDWNNRFVEGGEPFAYLKISDGCDRACSYCAIPQIRGSFRSRPLLSILREAEFLAGEGKKELILVSQDATLYGHKYPDGNPPNLRTLLRELEQIDGVDWIRLLYLHPAGISEDLIRYMSSGGKILPYFDLPLQHINSDILKAMRRKVDRPRTEEIIKTIRSASPMSAIRTTFIVGFPGETEAQFEELKQFVTDNEFERLGVFTYSEESGTHASGLPDQISMEVRYGRLDEIMMTQQEIAFETNNSLIGEIRDVIIDAIHEDGYARGRTFADCPEIDQEVRVEGAGLEVGNIVRVKITASEGYDLEGIVDEG